MTITIKKIIVAAHSASQYTNKAKIYFSQSKALRKITTIPISITTIKNLIQPGYSAKVNSLSPKKTPTNIKKHTARINNNTTLAITSLITATNCVEAMTKKAVTKATIELRFFLVNSCPLIFSKPKILTLLL